LVEHPFLQKNSRANEFLAVSVPVKVAETELLHHVFDITRTERRLTPTKLLLRLLRHKELFSVWAE
jgi:hypothetical protein